MQTALYFQPQMSSNAIISGSFLWGQRVPIWGNVTVGVGTEPCDSAGINLEVGFILESEMTNSGIYWIRLYTWQRRLVYNILFFYKKNIL